MVLPTILMTMVWSATASAQTTGPTTANPDSPCQVMPGEPQKDGTLSGTLDDCNSVLKPPAVGDPDIVEQAPDAGKTPIITPGELPEQQSSDAPASNNPDSSAESAGYTTGQIVDAIGQADSVPGKLKDVDPQAIKVHDISILFEGVDAAVINASLAAHKQETEQLRAAIGSDGSVAAALKSKSLTPAGVVAAEIDDSDTLTIFAR